MKTAGRKFFGFAVIGCVGFAVDAAVLAALPVFGPYLGRALSFAAAVTTTYVLNRRFVFRHVSAKPSFLGGWARFVLANSGGGVLNLGVYAILITAQPPFFGNTFIALAIGALCGLVANFTLTSLFVFPDARAADRQERR